MVTKVLKAKPGKQTIAKAATPAVTRSGKKTTAKPVVTAALPAGLEAFIVSLPLAAACFDATGGPVCANGEFRRLVADKVGAWQTLGAGALEAIVGVSLRAGVSRAKVTLGGHKYDGRLHALGEQQQWRVLVLQGAATAKSAAAHEGIEFLAHAAHQLRSPLSSLLGFSELLLNFEFDEASRRDFTESIHSQAARLSRLLNDLVDLAKVESQGAAVLKMEADDLAAIAREAISAFGSANKTANLAEALLPDLPRVECDREKVARMLGHLLENALQFSSPDSLIRVSTLRDRAGTQVGLSVEDHGSGIAAADLPRVGEKFFRSETAAMPGNGLGLALVKAVMQAHGGTLKIDNVPGEKTVMTLWFPLTQCSQRAQ